MEAVGSDLHKGLSDQEAAIRLEKNGPNELKGKPHATLWEMLLEQFKDFLVIILIVASIVSAFVGEVTDSLVIIVIVVLNAALGVFQEAKAEKAMEALQKMAAPNSKVVRGGSILTVPSRELVVGDVVLLEAGDYIPADVRILESMNLKVEEASLTGESVPVEKETQALDHEASLADRHNMGYMGTVATYGRGRAVVIGTGMDTEIGKIAQMLDTFEDQSTPLQDKLAEFGKLLGILCLVVCALVFALGIYQGYRDGHLTMDEVTLLFMTAVSLAVAAIPEGLPAVVTIVLAIGMFRSSGNLAAAYGIAVTTDMLITTVLTFFVVRYAWKFSLALTLAATGVFLTVDLLFWSSNLLKLIHGGWFPLAIAGSIFLLMVTWRDGRALLHKALQDTALDLKDFLPSLFVSPPTRVEGTAVFLSTDPDIVPNALLHNLKHNKVLHEQNLFVSVHQHEIPWIGMDKRLEVEPLGHDCWQIVLHYGFKNDPDLPKALGLLAGRGIKLDPMSTSYFLSRHIVTPTMGTGLMPWREKLFAYMHHTATQAAEYLNLPSNAVVELGGKVEI